MPKSRLSSSKTPPKKENASAVGASGSGRRSSAPELTSAEFNKICFLLKVRSGVDFSEYKPTTLRRRIIRRCQLKHFSTVSSYLERLVENPEEVDDLFNDLLINVTAFFRDESAFQVLKKRVLPKIIEHKQSGGDIRIWVAGCATGEEAYSLAICLWEELKEKVGEIRVQIFATDLSPQAISVARRGIYPASRAKEISPERLERFFIKTKRGYQVTQPIRSMCTFAVQNICQDPPFSRLDLVSCRNVLIYLGPVLQNRVLPIFHYALNPEGYLILGPSETVGPFADLFSLMDKKQKIYTKKPTAIQADLHFTTSLQPSVRPAAVAPPVPKKKPMDKNIDLQAEINQLVMNHSAPCGVVINSKMEVLQFRGTTGRFLEHASGTASLNLLHMVHPGLLTDLRTAIAKALKNSATVQKATTRLHEHGQAREVTFYVIPLSGGNLEGECLLVLFEEKWEPAKAGKRKGASAEEVIRLRGELEANKESLQSIIEELEAGNEELKSANEEIESSLEELQSTNEELQTAKEELQSTNEELQSANEELSARNSEMAKLNDDLSNLLSSINVPIVMVDNALIVRRITPQARKYFNLIPSDISRPFTDLKPNLVVPDLEKMLTTVMEDLTPQEAEVMDHDGRWHSLRIRPYRTKENKINGAVMTLVDIHDVKRSIEQLELASEFSKAIVDGVYQPILVLDASLRVRKANRAFYDMFAIDERNTEGVLLYNLEHNFWKNPKLRAQLENVLPKKHQFKGFEVRPKLDGKKERRMLISARSLENHSEQLILVFIDDRS